MIFFPGSFPSFLQEVLLHKSMQTMLFLKHLYLLLIQSLVQPEKLLSVRTKRAGKLLVNIGTMEDLL